MQAWLINSTTGEFCYGNSTYNNQNAVRPIFFLDANVNYVCGNESLETPYRLFIAKQ